jgi:putative hemolysin
VQRAIIFFAALWLVPVYSESSAQMQPPQQLANPASQNCVARGGGLKIERRPGGGQFGVCVFTDNYQCEEWALFRGECPAGGLRVTGYATPAARYCAITGGRYAVVGNIGTAGEQGACALPGGKACDADAYYAGTCGR